MEPRDRAAEALTVVRTRLRLLAASVLLVGLAFVQDPGFTTSDTKFDLVVSPGRFLSRALHLWDPAGALGQLQNQAYGYLWPMGPFFLVGHVSGVPGWAVQRAWLALVLVVAFLGAALLARALGVRSDLACVVTGFAFALSPRMLTTLGPISIEAWPSALAPWVLLPLVIGSRQGSPRRAAALAAVAVAMVGGVNAAATFAVLPMGVLWLITRTPGPRRRTLMLWWPLFTAMGTLWWLVPLLVMGRYSPPFLDYIETSSVTAFPTDLFDALRGTSNWVPYVSAASRAGNDLLVRGFLPLASGVVLMVGFAGLLDRRNPHRLFLSLSVLVGVLMVTAGHTGPVSGWFAGDARVLLDGALRPLRNVHKFDPIIRLPLVLGLGSVLDRVVAWRPERTADALGRVNQVSFAAMTLIAVTASVTPAIAGRIAPADPVLGVPGYWEQTGDWLDAHQDRGAALLVPGSGFADYAWGSPKDEPLQYLTTAPWTVRNQIPLTPPGNIRMLNGLEQRFTEGRGSAGLAAALRRAGIRFLVVRNDLRASSDVPDPVLVHQTLAETPGVARVAAFGPLVGGGAHLRQGGTRIVINGGWQAEYPAVEVFAVDGAGPGASLTASPATVAGGPEDVPDLADLGVLGSGAAVLAADVPDRRRTGVLAQGPLVLTDGLRRREAFYPRLHDGVSAALTPGDVRRSSNPRRDYLAPGQDAWSTVARLDGARSLSASSSASDSDARGGSRRGELPYAAVDGTAGTQWRTDPGATGPAWWRIAFDTTRAVTSVDLIGGAGAAEEQTVRVVTARGRSRTTRLGPGDRVTMELPAGRTRWLEVEAGPGYRGQLALAEVDVPGVRVVRRLALPILPGSWGVPDAVVLRADLDARRGCVVVGSTVRCDPDKQRADEDGVGMSRVVTLAQAQRYLPRLTVRARPGRDLARLLLADQPVGVEASSTSLADPRGSAVAAIDGDPSTTWIAERSDLRPSLTLNWLGVRPVTGISLTRSADAAARLPTTVTLIWPDGQRRVRLDSGRATFPAIRTDRLEVRVDRAEDARGLGFDAQPRDLGVGVGEIRLRGVPYLPARPSTQPVTRACGSGPTLSVNDRTYRTTVGASAAEILGGGDLDAVVCGAGDEPGTGRPGLDLAPGGNIVSLDRAADFEPVSLVLVRPDGVLAQTSTPVPTRADGPAGFRVDVGGAGAGILSRPQNENPGWRAALGGKALEPITVDGWRQGWLTSGAGISTRQSVEGAFGPDTGYRAGLLVGGLTWVALLVLVASGRLRGREDDPAATERPAGPVLLGLGAAVAIGLVAGWWGAVVGALVVLGAAYLQDQRGHLAPWVLAVPCLVVGLAFFVQPWGAPSGWAGEHAWPVYLLLVPLVATVSSAATGRPRFLSRIAGPSTRR